jgi:sensor c-di-GMP phosphodiesterase-like protein
MSRTYKNRVFISRLAIVALATSGTIGGYFLGCALAIQMAQYGLDQYARLMVVQEDASAAEARTLLGTLNSSKYPPCSEAEIGYFRELVFQSDYLKDAGRIEGGKIVCSATAGRPTKAMVQLTASSTLQDGTIAYSNLVPVTALHAKRNGLQLGSAYVVFGSSAPASLGTMPMHLSATMKGDRGGQAGPDLSAEGMVRRGDTLYATRCSAVYSTCLTASNTVPEALIGERATVAVAMILGMASGALLGIAFSMMYRRSLNLEQQLRRAISRNELRVVYQPIVNLANGNIVGAEALTRWTNEEGSEVHPDVFIKIAEEHGFISQITRTVIQRTLQSFSETLISRPGFRISVNVAAADLSDPEFLPMLDESVKRAKVKSKSLVMEITERSTNESVQAMDTIRALRHRGHSIHIDDFGTGYSNLDRLLYLWADTIKIDKAFTRVIGTESVTVAILPQILEMAKSLNLEVVVEGVENTQQANYFNPSDEQRIYGQGWLYGRPVSAEEFHTLLAGESSQAAAQPELVASRSGGGRTLQMPMPAPALAGSRAYR